MDFNFSSLANTSFTSNSQNYLKPYNIYLVKLSKFEKTELQGKDKVTTYPVINVEFTGEEGVFNENIFIPTKEEDFVRRENENTHKQMPSRFDHFQFTLMQIVEAINPNGAAKIKENASKLRTVDDFISIVTKVLNGKNDVEVYLKLIGQNINGKVYARLPNSCLIGKDGNPAALNFINPNKEKLFFSNYEAAQAKQYQEAKPTEMSDVDKGEEFSLDDIDLE